MICHWPAESGPKNSTKHQTCTDQTHQVGLEMKISDDQWHRHAENENYKAVKQRASGREHPKPSLDRFHRRTIQQCGEAFRERQIGHWFTPGAVVTASLCRGAGLRCDSARRHSAGATTDCLLKGNGKSGGYNPNPITNDDTLVSKRWLPLVSARFLAVLRLMIFTANLGDVHSWFRQLHVHLFHLPDEDL